MENTYKTVVQGEASESEEDEEKISQSPQPVVVQGEASESDEEEIDTSANKNSDIPPIKLSRSPHSSMDSMEENGSSSSSSPKHISRPKYDSLLNKKLWESNLSLCNNLNGVISQTYLSAAKEITSYSHQLTRSHTAIQDVSHHMRLMTNDLFNLDDRIDIITTCKLLPDIKFPPIAESATVSTVP